MSAPEDEFPPHERDTIPAVEPENDVDVEPPVPAIPRGFARHAMIAALADLQRAVDYAGATAMALARALDGEESS